MEFKIFSSWALTKETSRADRNRIDCTVIVVKIKIVVKKRIPRRE